MSEREFPGWAIKGRPGEGFDKGMFPELCGPCVTPSSPLHATFPSRCQCKLQAYFAMPLSLRDAADLAASASGPQRTVDLSPTLPMNTSTALRAAVDLSPLPKKGTSTADQTAPSDSAAGALPFPQSRCPQRHQQQQQQQQLRPGGCTPEGIAAPADCVSSVQPIMCPQQLLTTTAESARRSPTLASTAASIQYSSDCALQ